jgi:hypothetical protein
MKNRHWLLLRVQDFHTFRHFIAILCLIWCLSLLRTTNIECNHKFDKRKHNLNDVREIVKVIILRGFAIIRVLLRKCHIILIQLIYLYIRLFYFTTKKIPTKWNFVEFWVRKWSKHSKYNIWFNFDSISNKYWIFWLKNSYGVNVNFP